MVNIKEVVKDNTVRFSYLRAGVAYYSVDVKGTEYTFPIRLDSDLGEATLLAEDKAIFFMRYIRKALEKNEFHKTSK